VLGRDRLGSIPDDATVYAMPQVRERLPAGWRRGRLVARPPVFSPETARALLAFVLKRNLEAGRRAVRGKHHGAS